MPKRCGCGDTCACVIEPGEGTTVDGNGTVAQPYVIGLASGALQDRLSFVDTDTIDFTVIGPGTSTADMVVHADATLALTDLTDVDPNPPSSGDVPVWQGDHWEFQAPPVTPPGAVNVSNGIGGAGSVADPLRALTSGVFGTAPLTAARFSGTQDFGNEVYVDSVGNLRARPQVLWNNLPSTALPSAYPLGQSILTVNANNVSSWPGGAFGAVVTIKRMETSGAPDNGQTQQWWYRNNSPIVMYRYAANDAGGWSAWTQIGGLYSGQGVCPASFNLTATTVTDIGGATLTVPVVGTDSVYLVTLTIDVATIAATTNTFLGFLYYGGAQSTQQVIWIPTTGVGPVARTQISQTYRITGLAAGNQIFKAAAQCSTANQFRIASSHTVITVQQVA